MRRTNKRNNLKKRRKTLKKRFSKRGGVRKCCEICNECFEEKTVYGIPYDTHIQTHPICDYCDDKKRFNNNNELIKHLFKEHKNEYNIANSIIDTTRFNNPTLIDDLQQNKITLTDFYTRINNKIRKEAEKKKAAELKATPTISTPTTIQKSTKQQLKTEARATAKLAEEEAKKEAERLANEAKILARETAKKEAEAKRLAKETARKEEEAKKAEETKIARDLAYKQKKAEKKAAKEAANIERELAGMGEEDELATELRRNLIAATTVEDVEEIIDTNINNERSAQVTTRQETIDIYQLITQELNNLRFVNFYEAIRNLYPAMTVFNQDVSSFIPYKNINYGILFLVGIINNKLNKSNINLKLVLKGGKAAQMILSKNNFYTIKKNKVKCDIVSNDVDILLIQDGIYDYEFLLNFASQLADFIQYFFGNDVISTLKPPMLNNKNIVKISYMYFGIDPYSGFPNRNYDYIPLSDIDFKEVENDFFSPENIVSSENRWETNNGYTFNLLYYHQNLPTFIAEKEHYMNIYNEIIQKTPDDVDCDCSLLNDNNNECKRICNYRELMIEKFNKYIEPLEQVLQTISKK